VLILDVCTVLGHGVSCNEDWWPSSSKNRTDGPTSQSTFNTITVSTPRHTVCYCLQVTQPACGIAINVTAANDHRKQLDCNLLRRRPQIQSLMNTERRNVIRTTNYGTLARPACRHWCRHTASALLNSYKKDLSIFVTIHEVVRYEYMCERSAAWLICKPQATCSSFTLTVLHSLHSS